MVKVTPLAIILTDFFSANIPSFVLIRLSFVNTYPPLAAFHTLYFAKSFEKVIPGIPFNSPFIKVVSVCPSSADTDVNALIPINTATVNAIHFPFFNFIFSSYNNKQ